jgi:hypothetical protein
MQRGVDTSLHDGLCVPSMRELVSDKPGQLLLLLLLQQLLTAYCCCAI